VDLRKDGRFLESGLSTLQDVAEIGVRPGKPTDADVKPGRVVWTTGESARSLHIRHAYSELKIRSFCSKGPHRRSSAQSGMKLLVAAIEAAQLSKPFADIRITPFLPRPSAASAAEGLFGKAAWRGIWRALALGMSDYKEIAEYLGYSHQSVKNSVHPMILGVQSFAPGFLSRSGDRRSDLVRYATENFEYFLDDSVLRRFPPDCAHGIRRNRVVNREA
jgi:DNA-binding NarL/FixJ family response regulator